MNKNNNRIDMVATKNKHKAVSCSTPEHHADSPSRDSDSICDSEAASPVPFLCTQDGNEGETDVVWNFYTPKSGHSATSRVKNSTPLTHKSKKVRPKVIEKPLPKRRTLKISQQKTELFQELLELNKNLHELIAKKPANQPEKLQSGSEDDFFNDTQECSQNLSPKCIPRNSSRCLRKNVLSSNFGRPETDAALESDDSMNECLLKASQIVEEKILNSEPPPKRIRQSTRLSYKTDVNMKMDQDSMDAILNSIKLDSPANKKINNSCINNDSFDSFVGNLNDSALDHLTQMPVKSDPNKNKDWTVKELVIHDASPSSKSIFGRHNSMPESPSMPGSNKPSTSGIAFGRYNSMPFNQAESNATGDSPTRCTQDEIKKKHQLAREKLLAKRLLPFTSSPQSQLATQLSQFTLPKKVQFQPKVASNNHNYNMRSNVANESNPTDLKQLIEKKRQDALMKLRRRQPPK